MQNYIKINKAMDKLLRIQIILILFITLGNLFSQQLLVSLSFYLTFTILLLLFIFIGMDSTYTRREQITVILLLCILLATPFFINYNTVVLSFSYYRKVTMFFSTLLFFFCVTKLKVSTKTMNYLFCSIALSAVCFIIVYYFKERVYYAGGLTFNFSNPNLTAMWILHIILYCFLGILYYKRKIIKIVFLLLSFFLFYFLLLTKARTSLIALICYLILLIYTYIRKKIHFNNLLLLFLILFPLIFFILYMLLVNTELMDIFSFLQSEGKTLTSRYNVYNHALITFQNYPFFGDYYGISNGTGMSQMHNTHLDILASYGLIIFILTMIYLIRIVKDIQKKCLSKFQIISFISFLTIIVMGFGEAALFSGGIGMYILTGGFLLLSKNFSNIEIGE